MKSMFRYLPLVAVAVASTLSFSSCSKEQDAAPATPKASASSNVKDPNEISGPSVIGFGQQGTYKFVTLGYRSQWIVDESTGFTVISNTQSGNVTTLVLQAPTYPSAVEVQMDSDQPNPHQTSKLVQSDYFTVY